LGQIQAGVSAKGSSHRHRLTDKDAALASADVRGVKSRRKTVLSIVTLVFVVWVFAFFLPSQISYAEVAGYIGDLTARHIAVLAGLGCLLWLAQGALNASVLPGLGIARGTESYLTSNAMSNVVPGPSGTILRFATYLKWDFEAEVISGAVFLSGALSLFWKLIFPIVALPIAIATDYSSRKVILVSLLSMALAAFGAVVLVLTMRSQRFVDAVGREGQRLTNAAMLRLHRQPIYGVTDRVLRFRALLFTTLRTRWKTAVPTSAIAQLSFYVILVVSLRFCGVPHEVLSWGEIFMAFALVQLVTSLGLIPGGIGVVEAVYLSVLTGIAGDEYSNAIAAGIAVFRITTLLYPVVVGWIVFWWWSRHPSTESVR
jgi:uncharacterized membrane protein YbhN (UPF0104 family)